MSASVVSLQHRRRYDPGSLHSTYQRVALQHLRGCWQQFAYAWASSNRPLRPPVYSIPIPTYRWVTAGPGGWVGHRSSQPRGLSPLWYDFKFTLTDCLASQAFPPCPHCPLHHWRTQAQTVIWRSLTISLLLAAFRIPFLHQLLPQSAEPLPGYLLLSSHYSVGNGDVGTEVRPENSLVTAESWPEE